MYFDSPIKSRVLLALLGMWVLACSSVWAVQVSPSGTGQALIVPIYSTASNFDTLLAVSNTHGSGDVAVALKVHFIDSNEQVAGSFNVYLEALNTWGLGLTSDDGRLISGPFTGGCTLQTTSDGNAEVIDSLELDSTYGYVEIIEMGTISSETLLNALSEGDCSAFQKYWTDILEEGGNPNVQLDSPPGVTRANAALIDVPRGTMYSIDATGLVNFRNTELHTPPGDMAPDLTSASNDSGVTTSTNCYTSPCVSDEWINPIDAVSAALMTREMTGEYEISDTISAKTEWVLTAPTMRFYSDPESGIRDGAAILLLTDRQGNRQSPPPTPIVGQPSPPFTGSFESPLAVDRVVTIMHFIPETDPESSRSILSSADSLSIPAEFSSGTTRAGFTRFVNDSSPLLTSLGGRDYFGIPVIGAVLQEFNNGIIPDESGGSRIASFGNVFKPSYLLEGTE